MGDCHVRLTEFNVTREDLIAGGYRDLSAEPELYV